SAPSPPPPARPQLAAHVSCHVRRDVLRSGFARIAAGLGRSRFEPGVCRTVRHHIGHGIQLAAGPRPPPPPTRHRLPRPPPPGPPGRGPPPLSPASLPVGPPPLEHADAPA